MSQNVHQALAKPMCQLLKPMILQTAGTICFTHCYRSGPDFPLLCRCFDWRHFVRHLHGNFRKKSISFMGVYGPYQRFSIRLGLIDVYIYIYIYVCVCVCINDTWVFLHPCLFQCDLDGGIHLMELGSWEEDLRGKLKKASRILETCDNLLPLH